MNIKAVLLTLIFYIVLGLYAVITNGRLLAIILVSVVVFMVFYAEARRFFR